MSDLLAAAQFERDRREALAPDRLAEIRKSATEPAEFNARVDAMCVDFQCWAAIAEWIETGRFLFFYGGAEPARDDAKWIRWPELEGAAEAALVAINGRLAKLEADPATKPETFATLRERRSCLFAIHRKLHLMRLSIDDLNRRLREPENINQREGIAA